MKKSVKIPYNKLVRDKIPETIARRGSLCSIRKLGMKEFDEQLFKKLFEEVEELFSATSRKEYVAELGDILDVLAEMQKRKKITDEEIIAARKESFDRKGGFSKRIFLEWSEDDGYKKDKKYKKR